MTNANARMQSLSRAAGEQHLFKTKDSTQPVILRYSSTDLRTDRISHHPQLLFNRLQQWEKKLLMQHSVPNPKRTTGYTN